MKLRWIQHLPVSTNSGSAGCWNQNKALVGLAIRNCQQTLPTQECRTGAGKEAAVLAAVLAKIVTTATINRVCSHWRDSIGWHFHRVGVCRKHKKPMGRQSSEIQPAMKTGHAHMSLLLLRNTAYTGCATQRCVLHSYILTWCIGHGQWEQPKSFDALRMLKSRIQGQFE